MTNCPGCTTRMIDGCCRLCGYVAPPTLVNAGKNDGENQTSAINNSLELPVQNESVLREPSVNGSRRSIECKVCRKLVSRQASACPGCGHPVPKDIDLASSFVGLFLAIPLVIFIGIPCLMLLVGAVGSASTTSISQKPLAMSSLSTPAHTDSRTNEELVQRISRKYNETASEIMRLTLFAQHMLKSKYTIEMTHDEIMNIADSMFTSQSPITYSDLVSTYVTLREKRSHYDAIFFIQALFADLGI